MELNDSNKALLITILLSATILLMTFNIHLKKKNEMIAETFFEILPGEEPEIEELEDILKSLDEVMTTNKAFNETRDYDNFEDEEFKNTLEKIRNRDSKELDISDVTDSKSDSPQQNQEDLASFEEINDVIAKRSPDERSSPASSQDSRIRNSTISYSLVDRNAEYLPPPIYLCERGGKIVISIEVDMAGNVISAQFNNASTSKNQCLIDHAIEYALDSKFNPDARRFKQLGTITFMFQGKL